MYFGGQLIDAADADYDSYKSLGLLCPHCKSPVFLQAVSQRQVGNTRVYIPPHFKHFKAKDAALVKECEARVAKYDAKEIQRRAAQARNQRLRLLQRQFWGILTKYYESINFPVTNILEKDGHGFTVQVGHSLSNKFLKDKPDDLKKIMLQIINAAMDGGHIMFSWSPDDPNIGVSPSSKLQYHFRDSVATKLDRQMQELISFEVLDFLHSKSSRPLVEKLFSLATCVLLDAMGDGAILGLTGIDGPNLVVQTPQGKGVNTSFWNIPGNPVIFYHYASSHVVLWLGMLPWAKQLKTVWEK